MLWSATCSATTQRNGVQKQWGPGEGEINEKISNKNPALAESDQTNDALRRVLGWKTALDTLKGGVQHELRLEIKQELLEQYQASKSEQPPFKFKSHPSKGGDKKAGASPLARSEGSWKSQCGVEEDVNRLGHDLYDWAVKASFFWFFHSSPFCCFVVAGVYNLLQAS